MTIKPISIYKIVDIDLEYNICFFKTEKMTSTNNQQVAPPRMKVEKILSEISPSEFMYIDILTHNSYEYSNFMQMVGIKENNLDEVNKQK